MFNCRMGLATEGKMEDNKVVVKLISDAAEKPYNAHLVVESMPKAAEEVKPAPEEKPAEVAAPEPVAEPAPADEQEPAPASETPEETPQEAVTAQENAEAPPPNKEDGGEAPKDDKKPEEPGESSESPKKKFTLKKPKLTKGTVFIIVLAECMLLIIALVVFSRSVSLNRDDDVAYADPTQVDAISCIDGELNVNNVSVGVPKDNNVSYAISYTWGPEDKDYPSVPHAVTASYFDEDNNPTYDISLYRSDVVTGKKIPKGKDANNWFSDWATDDTPTNLHTPKDAGSLHGFLVSSREEIQKDDSGKTYGSSSYYFALQSPEGVSIYILEGILYDKASVNAFDTVMEDCINAIKIKPETI